MAPTRSTWTFAWHVSLSCPDRATASIEFSEDANYVFRRTTRAESSTDVFVASQCTHRMRNLQVSLPLIAWTHDEENKLYGADWPAQ